MKNAKLPRQKAQGRRQDAEMAPQIYMFCLLPSTFCLQVGSFSATCKVSSLEQDESPPAIPNISPIPWFNRPVSHAALHSDCRCDTDG